MRCLVAPLVALCLPAGAAQARIVPGDSIARIHLGDPRHRVDLLLGPSSNLQTGEYRYSRDYRRGRATVGFSIKGNRVDYVTTSSRWQRTANGIGPGVRASTMRRRLHGERCEQLDYVDDDGTSTTYGHCTTRSRSGATTDFVYSLTTYRLVFVTVAAG